MEAKKRRRVFCDVVSTDEMNETQERLTNRNDNPSILAAFFGQRRSDFTLERKRLHDE